MEHYFIPKITNKKILNNIAIFVYSITSCIRNIVKVKTKLILFECLNET